MHYVAKKSTFIFALARRSKPNKREMKIPEVFKGTLCQNLVIRMLRITNVESESLKLGQKYQK